MKKILGTKFGPDQVKIGFETRFFCRFLKFGSLVFLEITYNDSLQQFLTSSRGKIHTKNLGDQIWAFFLCMFYPSKGKTCKKIKIGFRIRSFAIFSSLVH